MRSTLRRVSALMGAVLEEARYLAFRLDRVEVGLLKAQRRRRQVRPARRFWTPAENAQLRALYPHRSSPEVARIIGRSLSSVNARSAALGLEKTPVRLAAMASASSLPVVGAATRFPKGHAPANKGLRRPGWAAGRMRETQFKKGQRGIRWMPIGSTRLVDGYQYTKVRDIRSTRSGVGFVPWTRNWKVSHILLWEKAHGPVPAGHAVAFKNGNRADIRLENLELVSRRELMHRNTIHNLPKPLAQVIQLRGALVRHINRRSA